jgi:hypothetical protein
MLHLHESDANLATGGEITYRDLQNTLFDLPTLGLDPVNDASKIALIAIAFA